MDELGEKVRILGRRKGYLQELYRAGEGLTLCANMWGIGSERRCSILQEYPIPRLADHAIIMFKLSGNSRFGDNIVLHLETTKVTKMLGFKYCQHDEDAL
jgi:hypothetical protein